MATPRFFHLCAHEQFPPDQLLQQAVAAAPRLLGSG